MKKHIALYALAISASVIHNSCASTLEDIRALEAAKNAADRAALPELTMPFPQDSASPVRTHTLPDGTRVDVADFRIVLFMQGSCRYCQQFDPQLVRFASQTGFRIFPYTLDNQGDTSFPDAVPAPRAVLDQFFGPGNNGVTPATFLVNVNTLMAWPLGQGITDMDTLLQRLNLALMSAAGSSPGFVVR